MTLCVHITKDGLRCAPDFPNCINIPQCAQSGCFWRKWHDMPPDKMAPAEPPKFANLIA